MIIWIVNHYSYGPQQSAGTRHFDFAKKLTERGHSVYIIASSFYHKNRKELKIFDGSSFKFEKIEDINFVWLKTNSYKDSKVKRFFNITIFAFKVRFGKWKKRLSTPDIIIGSSPSPFAALSAFFLSKKYRKPFFLEIRDLWPDSLLELGNMNEFHPVYLIFKLIEIKLYRSASVIISLLPNIYDHVHKTARCPKEIVWIPNGVDFNQFKTNKIDQFLEKKDKFTFIYAGAHGPYNSLDKVIDAAYIIQSKKIDNIKIVLIGDGPLKNKLIDYTKEKNVKNVEFLDSVPKTDIYTLLEQADAFIMPLCKAKAFSYGISPNKLWDYMAVGRPILYSVEASNNPVRDCKCGFTAEPEVPQSIAEGLIYISSLSIEERIAMGNRARKYVQENVDINVTSKRLEKKMENKIRQ